MPPKACHEIRFYIAVIHVYKVLNRVHNVFVMEITLDNGHWMKAAHGHRPLGWVHLTAINLLHSEWFFDHSKTVSACFMAYKSLQQYDKLTLSVNLNHLQ